MSFAHDPPNKAVSPLWLVRCASRNNASLSWNWLSVTKFRVGSLDPTICGAVSLYYVDDSSVREITLLYSTRFICENGRCTSIDLEHSFVYHGSH